MSAENNDREALRDIGPSLRREFGCYLTPWPLAALMARRLVGALDLDGKIIDPAAGTGRLLTCVARELARRAPGRSPAEAIVGVEVQSKLARWTNDHLQSLWGTSETLCAVSDALHLLTPVRRRELLGAEWFSGVIANPPYVREKNHRLLFRRLLQQEPGWRRYFGPRQDLQQLFLILGLLLLKPRGHLVFLMNSYWLHSDSGETARRLLRERALLVSLVDFGELRLFPGARGQHNLLIHVKDARESKGTIEDTKLIRVERRPPGGVSELCLGLEQTLDGDPPPAYLDLRDGSEILSRGHRCRWYLPGPVEGLISRMEGASVPLGRVFRTHQGVISGADRVTPYNRSWVPQTISLETGIFLLTADELAALDLSEEETRWVRRVYRARQIRPFEIEGAASSEQFVLYLHRGASLQGCPRIRRHLERFRTLLERRREVRTGLIPWYQLQWPRDPSLFSRPRLVTPRRSQQPRFAMGLADYCEQSDVAMIVSPDDVSVRLAGLMVVLNSELMSLWCRYRGKHKGVVREFFGRALEEMPLPSALVEQPSAFDELAAFASGREREQADRQVARLFRC